MVVQMSDDDLHSFVSILVGDGVADGLDDIDSEFSWHPQIVVVQMLQRWTHHYLDVRKHRSTTDFLQNLRSVFFQLLNVHG